MYNKSTGKDGFLLWIGHSSVNVLDAVRTLSASLLAVADRQNFAQPREKTRMPQYSGSIPEFPAFYLDILPI